MNLIFQIFGYIGSGLLSILLIPQVYKTRKTREVNGLAIEWLITNFFTSLIWIVYAVGFFVEENYLDGSIIMFANSSVMFLNVMLIYCYYKYK
tara:strand:+ start:408 stop:686 length:279 start_codon:yes stop_codon:yes gene_type:complete